MSKAGSSKHSSRYNKQGLSRKGSELKNPDGTDYEMISKVDSHRRPSVFDQNPHYKRSIINSILKPSDQNN